jgi:predicted TIM-barrel fold metal-dependent hydrolase
MKAMRSENAPLCEAPRSASSPRHRPPSGSTDCHLHIFGLPERYKWSLTRGYTPPSNAGILVYLATAGILGIDRFVIVQPTAYGTDHSCAMDAIQALGPLRARAVAAIDTSFGRPAILELQRHGFCATRVNAVTPNGVNLDSLQKIARLIASFGWHIELFVHGALLPQLAPSLLSLPVPVVIDHMGDLPIDRGVNSTEFITLLRLLDSGKCWLKLCGYRISISGPPYADLKVPAQKLIQFAPERCVWGTDWPHTRKYGAELPDDGKLLDLLYDWSPDSTKLKRILVDNPARLYGFAESSRRRSDVTRDST